MDTHLPDYLYKYAPLRGFHESSDGVKVSRFKTMEDILIGNQIYYSNPLYFNDPFEFDRIFLRLAQQERNNVIMKETESLIREGKIPEIKSTADKPIVSMNYNEALDEMEIDKHLSTDQIIYRLGYISLCGSFDNILMWSHYADSHKGVCIRFRCQKDKFYENDDSGQAVRVQYGDDIVFKEVGSLKDNEAIFEKMARKALCWQYEDEYRIYKVPSELSANDSQGNAHFNSKLVDRVYFGLRTPLEDIERIISITESRHSELKFFKAKKGGLSLKLSFQKIVP